MASIIDVVIDERKNLEAIDPAELNRTMLMKQAARFGAYTSKKTIYKDYLLSSEVFYVDSDL